MGFSLSADCMADRFILFSSQGGSLIGYVELE